MHDILKPLLKLTAAPLTALVLALGMACGEAEPIVTSVVPEFAPADSLIIVQGEHLEGITEMRFDGQLVNFNTAYNADQALLFRVPRNVPPAQYTVTLETDGGTASFPFRVSEAAPQIIEILQDQAALGEVIKIYGANFFDPLEIYFSGGLDEEMRPLDSVPGEIVSFTADTICARVPDNARAGYVHVIANGGYVRSPAPLDVVNALLITDFDGNGLRPDLDTYFSRARQLDQNPRDLSTFVRLHDSPEPIDGQFLKLSGRRTSADLLGGLAIPRTGEPLGIVTPNLRTLVTFDVHNGGRDNTFLKVILTDSDGIDYDLQTRGIRLEEEGWVRVAEPFTRFTNAGAPVDPAKVIGVRFFLFDDSGTGEPMEANIDNVAIAEIL